MEYFISKIFYKITKSARTKLPKLGPTTLRVLHNYLYESRKRFEIFPFSWVIKYLDFIYGLNFFPYVDYILF